MKVITQITDRLRRIISTRIATATLGNRNRACADLKEDKKQFVNIANIDLKKRRDYEEKALVEAIKKYKADRLDFLIMEAEQNLFELKRERALQVFIEKHLQMIKQQEKAEEEAARQKWLAILVKSSKEKQIYIKHQQMLIQRWTLPKTIELEKTEYYDCRQSMKSSNLIKIARLERELILVTKYFVDLEKSGYVACYVNNMHWNACQAQSLSQMITFTCEKPLDTLKYLDKSNLNLFRSDRKRSQHQGNESNKH